MSAWSCSLRLRTRPSAMLQPPTRSASAALAVSSRNHSTATSAARRASRAVRKPHSAACSTSASSAAASPIRRLCGDKTNLPPGRHACFYDKGHDGPHEQERPAASIFGGMA